jgi:hypothetical protein
VSAPSQASSAAASTTTKVQMTACSRPDIADAAPPAATGRRGRFDRRRLVLAGQPVTPTDPPRDKVLAAHRLGDGLHRHHAAVLAQVGDQPGIRCRS